MKKSYFKPLVVLSLIGALAIGSFSQTYAAAASNEKEFSGYLMDGHCAKTGVDDETGKINLKLYPEKHTTSCLKIDMCMKAGLGIAIKEGKEYKYYKFDKLGSKKADDAIMMKTRRKFGNKIVVKGTIKGDTITISSIKEAK